MATRKRSSPPSELPPKTPQDESPDSVYYSRWFNEDALVNQRLTWLLLAQGLLFAAYGTVATKAVDSCDEKADYLFSVLGLISSVGQIFALVIFLGIGAAIAAQGILHYKRTAGWRNIGVSTPTTALGWLTGLAVPVIFYVAWQYFPKPDVQKVAAACKVSAAASTPVAASAASSVSPIGKAASSPPKAPVP